MTKRWERELRRLEDVDAPTDRIRARAAQRPVEPWRGNGLPPRRQRITAGVVAAVVFVSAGTFAWQAFRPEGKDGRIAGGASAATTQIAIELGVAELDTAGLGEMYPTATMTVGDSSTQGIPTSFEWTNGSSSGIFDTVTPEFSTEDFVSVVLPAEVAVQGEADDAYLWLHPTRSSGDVALGDGIDLDGIDLGSMHDAPLTVASEAGRYVIEARASWSQGDVSFYFPIELVEPAVTAEPQAVLSFVAKNAPEGTIEYDGNEQPGLRREYTWCGGGDRCSVVNIFPPPVGEFLSIPAGTELSLDGPVTSIEGEFRTLANERASDAIEGPAQLGTVPTEPGRYVLELHVALTGGNGAHGSATFWFGVEVVESATTSGAEGQIEDLVGTRWHITALDGITLPGEMRDASLEFGPEFIGGWSGCNAFGGPYRIEGSDLIVEGIGGDAAWCVDAQQALYDALTGRSAIDLAGDTLTLTGRATVTLVAADAAPVDVLRIACLPGGTHVLDTRVVATRAGVTVSLDDFGHADAVRFEPVDAGLQEMGDISLRREEQELALAHAPGFWIVRCMAPEQGAESAARIEVLDPDGLWAAPEVECQSASGVEIRVNPAAPTLEAAVRRALKVQPGDVVRRPWYPGTLVGLTLPGRLVVVRDGRTVAALDVFESLVSGDVCDDAGLAPAP